MTVSLIRPCSWTHGVYPENPCHAEAAGKVCLKWPMWLTQVRAQFWDHQRGEDCGKGCCDR